MVTTQRVQISFLKLFIHYIVLSAQMVTTQTVQISFASAEILYFNVNHSVMQYEIGRIFILYTCSVQIKTIFLRRGFLYNKLISLTQDYTNTYVKESEL
jgi:hypothetical protein